jgi:hypothetical protein
MMGLFEQPRSARDAIRAYCAAANKLAPLCASCLVMYRNHIAGEVRRQALKQEPMLSPAAGCGPPQAAEARR